MSLQTEFIIERNKKEMERKQVNKLFPHTITVLTTICKFNLFAGRMQPGLDGFGALGLKRTRGRCAVGLEVAASLRAAEVNINE